MKNLIIKNYKILILFAIALISWSACREDDDAVKLTPPTIDLISSAVDSLGVPINPLVDTKIGYANNVYVIKGKGLASVKNIYFNDFESFFNTNLVTDNTIIVTINEDTPYVNGSNKLKLVTGTGTYLFDFTVAPPAPVFNGFQSINAADGSNIVLKGDYFVNPTVTVGGVKANIVSFDLNKITATLPAGSQGQKVTVTTLSGSLTYPSQIGTSFYDDVFYGGVTANPWGGDSEPVNRAYSEDPLNVQQGEKAIEYKANSFSALQCDNSPGIPSTAKGLRFYAKGSSANTNGLKLILNYSYVKTPSVSLSTNYQYYEIPWSEFGLSAAPSNMNVTYNNNTNTKNIIYLDDIGYYK